MFISFIIIAIISILFLFIVLIEGCSCNRTAVIIQEAAVAKLATACVCRNGNYSQQPEHLDTHALCSGPDKAEMEAMLMKPLEAHLSNTVRRKRKTPVNIRSKQRETYTHTC